MGTQRQEHIPGDAIECQTSIIPKVMLAVLAAFVAGFKLFINHSLRFAQK
jgi:hypothetical protein